jgi:hypothetical protein
LGCSINDAVKIVCPYILNDSLQNKFKIYKKLYENQYCTFKQVIWSDIRDDIFKEQIKQSLKGIIYKVDYINIKISWQ